MRMNVEKGGKNTMGKSREKYHMVYGIVPYGIGIVPYGIWYRTVWYWASRVEKTACLCEEEACLLQGWVLVVESVQKERICSSFGRQKV
jgi:uncharacterized membrane protein (GlpM family)